MLQNNGGAICKAVRRSNTRTSKDLCTSPGPVLSLVPSLPSRITTRPCRTIRVDKQARCPKRGSLAAPLFVQAGPILAVTFCTVSVTIETLCVVSPPEGRTRNPASYVRQQGVPVAIFVTG